MQIVLDQDQWEVADGTLLGEIFAQVSDRAQAKERFVTSLSIGERRLTDRDLEPTLLARAANEVGPIKATSKALKDILAEAQPTLTQFETELKAEARTLLSSIRAGLNGVNSVDAWLGRFADYIEMVELVRTQAGDRSQETSLTPWISELLEARTAGDSVRVTDVLEFELIPRMSQKS
jgi:ABC-type transporter Mla subunit MlaD